MSPKRYAEGTQVSVESSRGEITGILAKHGVVSMMWGTEPMGDVLQFSLQGKSFRFVIAKPRPEEVRERDGGQYTYPGNIDWVAKTAQEWKRRWRAHVLLLKAKLEFIEGGDTTLEKEFMPYMLTSDGRTIGELVESGGVKMLAAGK